MAAYFDAAHIDFDVVAVRAMDVGSVLVVAALLDVPCADGAASSNVSVLVHGEWLAGTLQNTSESGAWSW